MRLGWLTDIHLNFLSKEEISIFWDKVSEELYEKDCHGLIITGDISTGKRVADDLVTVAKALKSHIYFVLGNHDFYDSAVSLVRSKISSLDEYYLHYLTTSPAIQLDVDTMIVGVDGWADGRHGDFKRTYVRMNDQHYIEDLQVMCSLQGRHGLLTKMQSLADADARRLNTLLKAAIKKSPKTIIVATHIPPYPEAALYKGKLSERSHAPFFISKATGKVLTRVAKRHPEINFLILCGHTHSDAEYQKADNLLIKTSGAEYYSPGPVRIIEL